MSTDDDGWLRPNPHHFIHPDTELYLCWCPHCRKILDSLRGDIHVFPSGGRHRPFCAIHRDEDDLVPVTDDTIRAAYRLGGARAASTVAKKLWPK